MSSTSSPVQILLATAHGCWGLDEDAPLLVAELEALGVGVAPAVWNDPAVDWSQADLVVIRSTWDYPPHLSEFLDWAESVQEHSKLHNPAEIVRWNTDKRYLEDLAAAGLPVVPTSFVAPGTKSAELSEVIAQRLSSAGEVVVKPSVSIGSRDTGRFGTGELQAATTLGESILDSDRSVMVQPYLQAVDERGETGLVYFDGSFSHAFNKAALLAPGGETEHGVFALESISAHTATMDELAVGEAVIEVLRHRYGTPPLYARVDLLHTEADGIELLELELTEPSWFLATDPRAARRAAEAIVAAIG